MKRVDFAQFGQFCCVTEEFNKNLPILSLEFLLKVIHKDFILVQFFSLVDICSCSSSSTFITTQFSLFYFPISAHFFELEVVVTVIQRKSEKGFTGLGRQWQNCLLWFMLTFSLPLSSHIHINQVYALGRRLE